MRYVTESQRHQSLLTGHESGQLSLSDELSLEPLLHTWEEVKLVTQVGRRRRTRRRRKKGVRTSSLMLAGISAGTEEGVAVWCICCHAVDSHARSNEHGAESSRARKKELPNKLLSRFTDYIKRGDLLLKKLKRCCEIIQVWEELLCLVTWNTDDTRVSQKLNQISVVKCIYFFNNWPLIKNKIK